VTDVISGEFAGRMVLSHDARVDGRIDGDLEVVGGARVDLYGRVTGDLIADTGAVIAVHGTVGGAVINNGGTVTVFGEVGSITGTHPTHVDPRAVVRS
jgi:cytoskeletal protein CcmA (bactofilin family)